MRLDEVSYNLQNSERPRREDGNEDTFSPSLPLSHHHPPRHRPHPLPQSQVHPAYPLPPRTHATLSYRIPLHSGYCQAQSFSLHLARFESCSVVGNECKRYSDPSSTPSRTKSERISTHFCRINTPFHPSLTSKQALWRNGSAWSS